MCRAVWRHRMNCAIQHHLTDSAVGIAWRSWDRLSMTRSTIDRLARTAGAPPPCAQRAAQRHTSSPHFALVSLHFAICVPHSAGVRGRVLRIQRAWGLSHQRNRQVSPNDRQERVSDDALARRTLDLDTDHMQICLARIFERVWRQRRPPQHWRWHHQCGDLA